MVAARDCDAVVALVPSGETAPSPFGVDAAEEIAAFPGATLALFADADALAAFGANPLDPACRTPAARAGHDQGRQWAAAVAEFLACDGPSAHRVECHGRQFLADLDDFGCAMEVEAAADGARHLDQ